MSLATMEAPRPSAPATLTAEVASILIAERNRIHAEALLLACRECYTAAEIQICSRGAEALAALRQRPADLLVMGLSFADMDGVDLLARVNEARLAAHTLITSSQWEEHILLSLRTARFEGAVDTASESLDAVRRALRLVGRGEGYISTPLRRYLIDELPASRPMRELTAAELRVLRVIGDGSDNQEAAGRLGLSTSTVQTHRRNIMRKLRVSTSAKLVREAVRLGLVHIVPVPSGREGFTPNLPKVG